MTGKYKPMCDVRKVPDSLTFTGRTSRELVTIQEEEQRRIAEDAAWLLARKIGRNQDSRQVLTKLGFTILGEADDLFYKTRPPKGWSKSTEGYWTTVKDEKGSERISQFYKGAIYDRDAFLDVES